MKFYIQVQRAGTDGKWQQVATHYSANGAISVADTDWGNPDNMRSRDVMAVRVIRGKREPVVVYERITS